MYDVFMKKADLHLHTYHSGDSNEQMENYCIAAIKNNIDIICITDHIECDGFYCNQPNFEKQYAEFQKLKAIYEGKVKMLLGVEFGEPHLHKDIFNSILQRPYDMIIASVHNVLDNYKKDGVVSPKQMSDMHYNSTLQMLEVGNFQVLGHLDFPRKFSRDFVEDKEKTYEILKKCVEKNIIPEINTSTMRRGDKPLPPIEAIQIYADLGGKYVTINSDSHSAAFTGSFFTEIFAQLPKGIKPVYVESKQLKLLND